MEEKIYSYRFNSKFVIPFSIMELNKKLNIKKFVKQLLSIKDCETPPDEEKNSPSLWKEVIQPMKEIENTRFVLNSVQDMLYFSMKFRYFELKNEALKKITAGRSLCVSTVRKKIKNQVRLSPSEFDLNIKLVVCYTGICFLIYSIETKKDTPIDIVLNLNYFFPKTDEQNYVNVYLEKSKQNGKDLITFDKPIPDFLLEKENIITQNILTKMILDKLRHYIELDNIDHRLYDRPIVYSYAVMCDDKELAPVGKIGAGFDPKHRYLRGLSALMDHKSSKDFDHNQFDIIYIDEGSLISFQMDFVCVWVAGWNEYNRTGLTMKLKNVYFNIFLLALTQFYTLSFLSYHHTKARDKGRINSIQRFLTSFRRYNIDLMFDVVSLNINLKNFYEKLTETYRIKDLKEKTDNNLSIDEAKILSKQESVMNYLLALLTFVGIPLGIITEMFGELEPLLLGNINEDNFIPSLILISAIVLDIILIIIFLLRKNKIKT